MPGADPAPHKRAERAGAPGESGRHGAPASTMDTAANVLVCRPSDGRGPGRRPEAAMCVQGVDVQCVLQFTLIHAAGCALHRRASRVIHCPKLFLILSLVFRSGKIGTETEKNEKERRTPGRAAGSSGASSSSRLRGAPAQHTPSLSTPLPSQEEGEKDGDAGRARAQTAPIWEQTGAAPGRGGERAATAPGAL